MSFKMGFIIAYPHLSCNSDVSMYNPRISKMSKLIVFVSAWHLRDWFRQETAITLENRPLNLRLLSPRLQPPEVKNMYPWSYSL